MKVKEKPGKRSTAASAAPARLVRSGTSPSRLSASLIVDPSVEKSTNVEVVSGKIHLVATEDGGTRGYGESLLFLVPHNGRVYTCTPVLDNTFQVSSTNFGPKLPKSTESAVGDSGGEATVGGSSGSICESLAGPSANQGSREEKLEQELAETKHHNSVLEREIRVLKEVKHDMVVAVVRGMELKRQVSQLEEQLAEAKGQGVDKNKDKEEVGPRVKGVPFIHVYISAVSDYQRVVNDEDGQQEAREALMSTIVMGLPYPGNPRSLVKLILEALISPDMRLVSLWPKTKEPEDGGWWKNLWKIPQVYCDILLELIDEKLLKEGVKTKRKPESTIKCILSRGRSDLFVSQGWGYPLPVMTRLEGLEQDPQFKGVLGVRIKKEKEFQEKIKPRALARLEAIKEKRRKDALEKAKKKLTKKDGVEKLTVKEPQASGGQGAVSDAQVKAASKRKKAEQGCQEVQKGVKKMKKVSKQ